MSTSTISGKLQIINSFPYYLTFKNNHINLYNANSLSLITQIQTVADNNESLNGKYLLLFTISKTYCVWFNVNNSVGPQLAIEKFSFIEVELDVNDSSNIVASKTKTQLDLVGEFVTILNNDILTITNNVNGLTSKPIDSNTNFIITILQKGNVSEIPIKSETLNDDVYDIHEANVNSSGDLTVLGIFKQSRQIKDECNKDVWSNEYFRDSKIYENWIEI